MSEAPTERDRLIEEAFDLVIRLQSDPSNPVAAERIRAWQAKSPAHEMAWQEVSEIYGMTGQILRERRHAEEAERKPSRRHILTGGALCLAAVATGMIAAPAILLRTKADIITATAEVRQLALPDGSTATLGPRTAIALGFSETARRVELLEGMALFDVRDDPALPFQAIGGALTASTHGASFDLASEDDSLAVSVERGHLDISFSQGVAGERLEAGQWLAFDQTRLTAQHGTRSSGGIAPWRDGLIVADGQQISTVVAQIGRWQSGRVVIANPSLGTRHVSGVFDLRRPIEALEAVVHPYGGNVRQITPYLTVISLV